MPSRDSQEVRHIAIARQARSGWPRWNSEAIAPSPVSSSDSSVAADEEQGLRRGAEQAQPGRELGPVEREKQALAGADQRGQEDDRETGTH